MTDISPRHATATPALPRYPYRDALRRSRLLECLGDYDPHVVGTLPLGIAVAGSDIDIVCHAPDAAAFADVIWTHYRDAAGFGLHQWAGSPRAVVGRFEVHDWPFEVFGSCEPVAEQAGWKHFDVERRLLDLGGAALHQRIRALRADGLKTEPAFAAALGLDGDPYAAMLALQAQTDHVLADLVKGMRR